MGELGDAGVPPLWDVGMADPQETSSYPYDTTPNLVTLGQTIWA